MKKSVIVLVSVFAVVFLVLGVWKFTQVYKYTSSHFPEKTTINGVNCSGLTADEAIERLTKVWNEKKILINSKGNDIATLKDFDYTYDIKDQMEEKLAPNIIQPILRYISKDENNLTVSMNIKKTTPSFEKQFASYYFLNNDYKVKTKNAYVDMSNKDFNVVKEVYGDNVDKNRFKKALLKAIAKGDDTLEYKESDYYQLPSIKSDDKSIEDTKKYCEKYLTKEITYTFYDKDYTIKPEDLNKMFKVVDDGTVSVREGKVKEFVSKLALEKNTVGSSRQFKATGGGTITVVGGNYGYSLNQEKETAELIKNLKSGKDIKRAPIYSNTPYAKGNNDIGNSYIEIDISSQRVWLYKNGSQIVSTATVTGNVEKGDGTPTGVYSIAYLEKDAVLRGENYDGSAYASPVNYWMPFNGGIGLHDAPWRKTFGSNYYLDDGSHGCVNLPDSAASTIFNSIESGYPVVVHY